MNNKPGVYGRLGLVVFAVASFAVLDVVITHWTSSRGKYVWAYCSTAFFLACGCAKVFLFKFIYLIIYFPYGILSGMIAGSILQAIPLLLTVI